MSEFDQPAGRRISGNRISGRHQPSQPASQRPPPSSQGTHAGFEASALRGPDYAAQGKRYVKIGAGIAALLLILLVLGTKSFLARAERERISSLSRSLAGGPRTWDEAEGYMFRANLLGECGPEASSAAPAVADLLLYTTMMGYSFEIVDVLEKLGPASVAPLLRNLSADSTYAARSVIAEDSGHFDITCYALSRFPGSTAELIAILERDPESTPGRNAAYALAFLARGTEFDWGGRQPRHVKVEPLPAAAAALERYVDVDDHYLSEAAAYGTGAD